MTDELNAQPSVEVLQEPEVAPATPQDQPTNYEPMLQAIKTQDGRQKYSNIEAALQSIPHAQAKIVELQNQIAQLQAELAQSKGVEEMLNALEQPAPVVPPVQQAPVEDLDGRIEQLLKQRELQTIAEQNRQKVEQTLLSKYGEKAEEVFANKAKELGVSVEYLTQQAIQAPQFVLAQFGTAAPASPANPTLPTHSPQTVATDLAARKSVMYGASTKDVIASWRAHAQTK